MTPTALLSPSYRQAVPSRSRPSSGPARDTASRSADYLVVGAGYAGLSYARDLARAGRSVVVLDAHRAGWWCQQPQRRDGHSRVEGRAGGPGARTVRWGAACTTRSTRRSTSWRPLIEAESIDCDYSRTGQLYLAHAERLVASYDGDGAGARRRVGEPVRFVPRDQLVTRWDRPPAHGRPGHRAHGRLHPARFHAGLYRLALAAGATLHRRRPRPRSTGRGGRAGFRVMTARGALDADTVVVCTNAYADDLLPELRRRVLPVGASSSPPRCSSPTWPARSAPAAACSSTARTSSSTGG